MGQVERLVEDFLAREDRKRAWFARQMGINDKTLSSWFRRGRQSTLPPGAIKAIARVTTIPYRTVLEAALTDSGYLPASAVTDIRDEKAKPRKLKVAKSVKRLEPKGKGAPDRAPR